MINYTCKLFLLSTQITHHRFWYVVLDQTIFASVTLIFDNQLVFAIVMAHTNQNEPSNEDGLPINRNDECVGPTSNKAGKASGCSGCPNQADCASGKYLKERETQKQSESALLARLENVQNILLVLSGKGGVGKSTISSQLAWSLANYGYDVGILDIDICGPSIARMMGVENEQVHKSQFGWTPVYRKSNLSVMSVAFLLSHKNDAIIWRGPRKNGLIKQFLIDVEWNNLDFLIIDCPPGTSDEHISIAQLLSGRKEDVYTLMVTTPQEVSLLDVRKEISFANKVGLNILGVVENMSGFMCPCCNKKTQIFKPSTGGAKVLCKQLNVEYLGSVPIDQLLLECCENGKSFLKYSANKEVNYGTRVAWLNVVKQITSRIDTKYRIDIERKENSKNNNTKKLLSQHGDDEDAVDDEDTATSDTESDDHPNENKTNENDQVRQHIDNLDNATNEFLLDID
eukprot:349908_1